MDNNGNFLKAASVKKNGVCGYRRLSKINEMVVPTDVPKSVGQANFVLV